MQSISLAKQPPLHFVVAGFPKAGTTSLMRNLSSEIEVDMPDYEAQVSQLHKISWHHDSCTIRGIKNPNLVYEPHNLLALIHHNPKLKIVLCMREPIQWLHSFYEYRMKEILEKKEWLRNVIKAHPQIKNITFKEVASGQKGFLGVQRAAGNYVDYIRYYYQHAEQSNIFVLFLEELAVDPDKCYSRLYSFLGLRSSPPQLPAIANVNTRKSALLPCDASLLAKYYEPKNHELWSFLRSEYGIKERFW